MQQSEVAVDICAEAPFNVLDSWRRLFSNEH
jgi:hypothetical protein